MGGNNKHDTLLQPFVYFLLVVLSWVLNELSKWMLAMFFHSYALQYLFLHIRFTAGGKLVVMLNNRLLIHLERCRERVKWRLKRFALECCHTFQRLWRRKSNKYTLFMCHVINKTKVVRKCAAPEKDYRLLQKGYCIVRRSRSKRSK